MSIVRTYTARPGSHISDADAQRVGGFLDREFGERVFTASDVLNVARPADSPIHGDFTWDREDAAEKWNLHEARQLIGAVMLVEETNDDGPVISRAYHHVVELTEMGTTSGYAIDRVVWQREDFAEQVVERAKREFLNWQQRYAHYGDLQKWAVAELEKSGA